MPLRNERPKADMTTKEILAHPSFHYMSDVFDITHPFFKNMNLNFFGHMTIYPNGEFSFLCNKHGWAEKIVAEEKLPPGGFVYYDQIVDAVVFPNMNKSNIFGWSDEVTVSSRDRFNILNPMMITQKYDDHYEGFVFDVHDSNAYEKYVGGFDIFEQFIHYYKDSAKKMLKKVRQQPLRVASQYLEGPEKSRGISGAASEILPTLPQVKRYYLKHGNIDIVLSKKEYYCLSLLAHGNQIKSIANTLGVSLRTVETYFERLKKKLNLTSRNELLSVYWQNRILSEQIHGIFS